MTTAQVTLMTTDEARAVVEQIKAKLDDVRTLVWDLREREGWRALGYETWHGCITEEFHMSERHAHRLLNAHMVDRILASPGSGGPVGQVEHSVAEIPERHARALEPLTSDPEAVREVYAEVVEQTSGKPTEAALRQAVDRRLGSETSEPPFEMPEEERESDEERAYYALTRQLLLVRFDPEAVADSAGYPGDALASFDELAAWFERFMMRLRTNAKRTLRRVE